MQLRASTRAVTSKPRFAYISGYGQLLHNPAEKSRRFGLKEPAFRK